jgi:hypothetical protein
MKDNLDTIEVYGKDLIISRLTSISWLLLKTEINLGKWVWTCKITLIKPLLRILMMLFTYLLRLVNLTRLNLMISIRDK